MFIQVKILGHTPWCTIAIPIVFTAGDRRNLTIFHKKNTSLCFEKIADPIFRIKKIKVRITAMNSTSWHPVLSRTLDSSSGYCFSASQFFELDHSPCKIFKADIETFLNHELILKNQYYFSYEELLNGML